MLNLIMSFSDLVQEQNQQPISLIEIDQKEASTLFLSYESGIWYINLTLLTELGLSYLPNPDPYNRTYKNVGSFSVNNEEYTSVSSLADLRSQNESWYYDTTTTFLYIHFDNFDPYYVFDLIKIGIVWGFCHTSILNGYTDDNGYFYEPRVSKMPVIKYKKDNLFFGIVSTPSSSFELLNGYDDDIDDIAQQNLYGNPCRVKLGYESLASSAFQQIFTGNISNIPTVGQDAVRIQIQNERAFLLKRLNNQLFSNDVSTEDFYYANLSDDWDNKPVPILFGECRNVPCINLDENSSPTNYTYKVCTTDFPNGDHYDITSIDKVYVDGIEKSIVSSDLVNGQFEIAGTTVKDGSSFFDVTADVKGYKESGSLIENPLRILEIILDSWADIEYISSNYDTTEWEASKAAVQGVCLYVGKRRRIEDLIEDISKSILKTDGTNAGGNLIIKGDGKITFRLKDDTAAIVKTITQDELLEIEEANYNTKEVLSTATCRYSKNWNSNTYRTKTDTTREQEVLSTTSIDREKEFDTLLTNKTDALAYAKAVMNDSYVVKAKFPIVTFLQSLELEIGNNINCEINRINKTWYGTKKCEILSHQIDLNNYEINMILEEVV